MIQVISFIIFPLGCLGIGNFILRCFRVRALGTRWVGFFHIIAFSLGVIFVSYYWLGVGLAGFIGPWALYIYWGIGLLSVLITWTDMTDLAKCLMKMAKDLGQSHWIVRLLALEMIAVLVLTLLRCGSSYIDGDSLVYHLYLPKQYVMQGAIWGVPFSEHAFWPLAAEMLFIPGELIGSLALSKFVSWLIYVGLSFMAGTFVFAKTENLSASVLSGFLIASIPYFFFHAPSTYNDLFFGFFLVGSFLMLNGRSMKSELSLREIGIGGLLCGASMACKYLGMFGIGILAAIIFLRALTSRNISKLFGQLFIFALGIAITGLPFYLRSFLEYGNPVFPYAQSVFHTSFGYGLEAAGLIGSNINQFLPGAGRGLMDFLLLPINLILQPDAFGGDKVGFLLIPSGFLVFFSLRKNFVGILFCVMYAAIWFILSQYTRYLVPVLAVLAMMNGIGYFAMSGRFPKFAKIILMLVVLIGGLHTLWAGYYAYQDFTIRNNRGLEEIAEWMNEEIPNSKEQVLVVGDSRIYYYDFVAFREKTFRNFTLYPDHKNPKETVHLLDKLGVDKIFLIKSQMVSPSLRSLFFLT